MGFHLVLLYKEPVKNPDKIVIATGDTNQLKNPEKVSGIFKFKDYANHCMELIFENFSCVNVSS